MIKRRATRPSDDAAIAMPFDLEAPAHVQPAIAVINGAARKSSPVGYWLVLGLITFLGLNAVIKIEATETRLFLVVMVIGLALGGSNRKEAATRKANRRLPVGSRPGFRPALASVLPQAHPENLLASLQSCCHHAGRRRERHHRRQTRPRLHRAQHDLDDSEVGLCPRCCLRRSSLRKAFQSLAGCSSASGVAK